jgi:hypothetical protein
LKSKIDQARKAKQEFLGKGEGPGKPGTTSGPGPGIRFSKAPPASLRGMTDQDDRFLGDLAAQEGKIILVRDSNPEALKWVGKKGYAPKPKILKAKTLKQGKYAGLASAKGLSDDEIKEILKFKSGVRNDEGELESVFKIGSAVEDFVISARGTGTRYYSDTDLHGIYNANGTDAWNDDIARIMNRNLGERMIQHGPQDKWVDRLDKAKVGDNAGPQAGNGKAVTAYLPDGSTQHLTTLQEMKSFYLARGMNWNAIYPGY